MSDTYVGNKIFKEKQRWQKAFFEKLRRKKAARFCLLANMLLLWDRKMHDETLKSTEGNCGTFWWRCLMYKRLCFIRNGKKVHGLNMSRAFLCFSFYRFLNTFDVHLNVELPLLKQESFVLSRPEKSSWNNNFCASVTFDENFQFGSRLARLKW